MRRYFNPPGIKEFRDVCLSALMCLYRELLGRDCSAQARNTGRRPSFCAALDKTCPGLLQTVRSNPLRIGLLEFLSILTVRKTPYIDHSLNWRTRNPEV